MLRTCNVLRIAGLPVLRNDELLKRYRYNDELLNHMHTSTLCTHLLLNRSKVLAKCFDREYRKIFSPRI
ncbi:MAG: hypothetical protein LBM98_09655 [Oscillospiraceae bacterium]|nr:hypothetical protein [Oscillospiraceae bacterium]